MGHSYLLTDNGKEFDNKDIGRILEVYGVTRVTTPPPPPPPPPTPPPPYRSQASPVERSNWTLKTMISSFVKNNHRS